MPRMTVGFAVILTVIALIVVCPRLNPLTYRPFVVRDAIDLIGDKMFAFEAMYNSRVAGKTSRF